MSQGRDTSGEGEGEGEDGDETSVGLDGEARDLAQMVRECQGWLPEGTSPKVRDKALELGLLRMEQCSRICSVCDPKARCADGTTASTISRLFRKSK